MPLKTCRKSLIGNTFHCHVHDEFEFFISGIPLQDNNKTLKINKMFKKCTWEWTTSIFGMLHYSWGYEWLKFAKIDFFSITLSDGQLCWVKLTRRVNRRCSITFKESFSTNHHPCSCSITVESDLYVLTSLVPYIR